MITLHQLMIRADVPTLENLIGLPAVNLLGALDRQLVRGESLRKVLFELLPETALILTPGSWREVVDLLSQAEAEGLCGELGMPTNSDAWLALRSLTIRRGSTVFGIVCSFFAIDEPAQEDTDLKDDVASVTPAYGLFPHQNTACREIEYLLGRHDRRAVLHMPTGSGKTRTAMNVICHHLRQGDAGSVVWLAYSEELCEQAASEFEKAWRALGNGSTSVIRFWGGYDPHLDAVPDGLVVAGLKKLYGRVVADPGLGARLGQRCSLIVIDEAHQAVAPTYRLLLESLQAANPKAAILGLTATPGRSWDDIDADRALARFFANTKVTLEVEGYSSAVEYLIDNGYLARPVFRSLFNASGISLSPSDRRKIIEELDVPEDVLHQLGEDDQRNLRIICEIEAMAARHSRILVFAPSVQAARLLAATLEAHGQVPARCVTGATPSTDRQRFIRWYLSGDQEPRVLCNYGVLTTGFDAPRTSAVVIARPTKSLVLYSQMVGRATRGPAAGGNQLAEIVTVVDTALPGFGELTEAFMNWEDSGWHTT